MPDAESQRYPTFLRQLEVIEARNLSPRMRRITLGGPQLGPCVIAGQSVPGFDHLGPDDHVKLFFPDPETGVTILPEQVGPRIRWPDNPPVISRDYTPRGFVKGAGRLDIDIVLHGNGVGSAWAAQAQPGLGVHIAGPRSSMMLPQAEACLLIGDESAVPAIANWLQFLPEGVPITAYLLVPNASAMLDLAPPDADVSWHFGDPAEPRAMVRLLDDRPISSSTYIWAGGEAGAIKALRGHLDRLDLDPGMIDLTTYWTAGQAQPR